jgi:hypothetical protein
MFVGEVGNSWWKTMTLIAYTVYYTLKAENNDPFNNKIPAI